jgi:hypothetical protein
MPRNELKSSCISLVRKQLEHQIQVRTGRRVQNLTVEVHPDEVILHGQATSYYIKQLAQVGAQDVLVDVPLRNAIAVKRPEDTDQR